MNNLLDKTLLGFLALIGIIIGLLTITQFSESSIPPTPAFKMINTTSGNVTASSYNGFVSFIEGSGITITPNYSLNKITFTSTSSGSPHEKYCFPNALSNFNATTLDYDCVTIPASTGEANTASSSGLGQSLILSKVGVDLPFKGISVSGDLTIGSNSTDITIGHVAGTTNPNTVLTNQANNYTAGMKQKFASSSTTAGVNFAGVSSDPSSLNNGDMWYDSAQAFFKGRLNGVTYKFVMDNKTQTMTNKIISSTSNTLTSTSIALGDILKSDGSAYKRFAKGSANQQIRVNAGGTDIEWFTPSSSSNPVTTLSADVPCTATASYCTVFTIALTNSKDHSITFNLSAETNTAGATPQIRVRGDQANTVGYCTITHYTTATAQVLDNIAISTSSADDGETTWLPAINVPQNIPVQCAFKTGSTAGSLFLEVQAEVASTVTINGGSNYIMTVAP